MAQDASVPKQSLSVFDATTLMVGMVIGVGIFGLPNLVASNTPSEGWFFGLFIAGAVVTLCGILCYAELAGRYPDAGGEYNFLTLAYGKPVGFLFAWGRLTVMQTGIMAGIAFLFGDYMSGLAKFGFGWANLGPYSSAIWAGVSIVALTAINIAGTKQGTRLQNILTVILVCAFATIVLSGIFLAPEVPPVVEKARAFDPEKVALGLAFVFVMLTYGGWNETVYVSGELKDSRRNMLRVFLIGLAVITTIYLLLLYAFVNTLGIVGVRNTFTIGADMMNVIFGPVGATVMTVIILAEIGTTLNATIFTGARTNYALGRDYRMFAWMGRWNAARNTPVNGLVAQAAIALGLVVLGAFDRDGGFKKMVEYTTPVFWSFMLLIVFSLFLFRMREGKPSGSYSVHFYPFVPLAFGGACCYMLYSSINYAWDNALLALSILAAGIPVYLVTRGMNSGEAARAP
jgi:amino acid transporter